MMLSVPCFYRGKIAPRIQCQLYDSVKASLHAFISSCMLNLINATSWLVFSDVLFSLYTPEIQLAITGAGVEKLKIPENRYNFGDRTSLRDPNQSFVGQPDAI
jgi:hypothetical protein